MKLEVRFNIKIDSERGSFCSIFHTPFLIQRQYFLKSNSKELCDLEEDPLFRPLIKYEVLFKFILILLFIFFLLARKPLSTRIHLNWFPIIPH